MCLILIKETPRKINTTLPEKLILLKFDGLNPGSGPGYTKFGTSKILTDSLSDIDYRSKTDIFGDV